MRRICGRKVVREWRNKDKKGKKRIKRLMNLHKPRKKSITPPIVKIRTERYAAASAA